MSKTYRGASQFGAEYKHSNSNRPSPPIKPIAFSPQQTEIAHITHQPDRLFPKSNRDRLSSLTKLDRLFPQIQTAIAITV